MIAESMQAQILQGMKAMRIVNQNCFLPACRHFDLTFQQFTILMELAHSSELTAGELSDHVCILRTNFASVTNKLGQRGLICQARSTRDRRYTVIQLTPKGEALVEEITQWLDQRYGNVFEEIPDGLFEDLVKGFQAMDHFAAKLEQINLQWERKSPNVK